MVATTAAAVIGNSHHAELRGHTQQGPVRPLLYKQQQWHYEPQLPMVEVPRRITHK
jgi:hypothetical protein